MSAFRPRISAKSVRKSGLCIELMIAGIRVLRTSNHPPKAKVTRSNRVGRANKFNQLTQLKAPLVRFN